MNKETIVRLAGKAIALDALESADIPLCHSVVLPISERWLNSPTMKQRLSKANAWMAKHPARETVLKNDIQRYEDVYGRAK